MASVVADAGVLAALVLRRDRYYRWAEAQAKQFATPWSTCEAAVTEAFFLLGRMGRAPLAGFLRAGVVRIRFDLSANLDVVLSMMEKYANVPMSLADACLVRMTELLPDPILLTTDADFTVYRRNGRHVIPCVMPRKR